jgi:peroxiredoxin
VTDDRDNDGPSSAPNSARRRLSAVTMPEVPLAKLADRQSGGSPFAVDVGDSAPLFELENESSVRVPLIALRGGPVVVVFGPASAHADLASALASARRELGRHGGASVLVVAGDASLAARVAAPHGREVVVLADATGAVHRAYGVLDSFTGRPRVAVFLLDAAGDVARVFAQPEPERVVRLALDAIELAR